MNGLKPIKIPSAKERVASELRKAILSRKMEEGENLSLESVAGQLNVSATPVREAFQILARDGLIRFFNSADISGIEESYETAKEALGKGDYESYANFNRDFHSEIWTAAGNHKMENMIAELWNGLSMGNMVTEEEYAKVSIQEHGKIVDAIRERNTVNAKKEMYDHIMRSRDDMLTYYK